MSQEPFAQILARIPDPYEVAPKAIPAGFRMNTFPLEEIAPLIVVATPPETWFRIAEALLGSEKVIVSPTPSAPPGPVPSEKLPQPNTVAAVEAEMVSVPVVPLPRAG